VGLAFQIKHAGGSLDFLLYELPTPKAYLFLGISFFALIVGFLLGRFRSRALGIIIASTAILSLTLSGSFTLITADRAMTKSELQIDP
jgi:Zn-dependent membrane protease YugP